MWREMDTDSGSLPDRPLAIRGGEAAPVVEVKAGAGAPAREDYDLWQQQIRGGSHDRPDEF